MKFRLNNKFFRWGITAFLVIAGGILFYYLMFHGSNIRNGFKTVTNILMPVVFGLVIAYLLTPILNFVENKMLIPFFTLIRWKESKKRREKLKS